MRRIRVIINPKSGARSVTAALLQGIESAWGGAACDVTYQISRSADDGREKTRRAVAEDIDTVIAVGGDGMVNTIGAELIGTPVALGVIPTGSGNGFARHFGIPLQGIKAAVELARADRCEIDVGAANGRPFFVTCSMAWDAELVKWFERSPVRGVRHRRWWPASQRWNLPFARCVAPAAAVCDPLVKRARAISR